MDLSGSRIFWKHKTTEGEMNKLDLVIFQRRESPAKLPGDTIS